MTDYAARMRLDGRVALVTGGGGGIGGATADALAQLGAAVAVSDIAEADALGVANGLRERGLQAHALRLDVTDPGSVEAGVAAVLERHGRLDILIANAGIGARQPAETMPLEDWQRVVDVNLTGSFLTCQAAARPMLAAGRGAVVVVSSIMGLVGGGLYPNAAYQTTKGGLVNMTRTLALEWADRGIRVNAVAPTFARTPLTTKLFADNRMFARIIDNTPLRRVAEAEEVASAIVFLAGDAASMITGATLPVDGGWTAR